MCGFTVLVTNDHNDCGIFNVMICHESNHGDPEPAEWWNRRDVIPCHIEFCRYKPDHTRIVPHYDPHTRRHFTCNELRCPKGPYIGRLRVVSDKEDCCGLKICRNCEGGHKYGSDDTQEYEVYYGPRFAEPWPVPSIPPVGNGYFVPEPARHDQPNPAGREPGTRVYQGPRHPRPPRPHRPWRY